MTADQFWNEDVWLTAVYHRAQELKTQRKSNELWLQGVYFYNAMAVVAHNVMKKKGTKSKEYLKEPLRVIPYTESEKEQMAQREREKVIEYLNAMQKNWKKRNKGGTER